MKTFGIDSDLVSLAVTETGGHLSEVVFRIGGEDVSPLHTAPWVDEDLEQGIPPILRVLRGDFFCAPFGDSDVEPSETRPHGATANGHWLLIEQTENELQLRLERPVSGATVEKNIQLRSGQTAIYQTHRFTGGEGELPLGHHLMVRADQRLRLGFGKHVWCGTPPSPLEPDPSSGRSLLAYPQQFETPTSVQRADGGTVDLTHYPWDSQHEDLCILVADPQQSLGWTAVTNATAGWVLYALKNTRELASTVMWMSHGGRYYAPWNSRHSHVLGLEEVTAYFHLGHSASLAANPLKQTGFPTTVRLTPQQPTVIRYIFGLTACSAEFGVVKKIAPTENGIELSDDAGQVISTAVDTSYLA